MVRELGGVGIAAGRVLESAERLAVQLELAVRRERFLDGEAGQLVPECHAAGDGCEHARRQAFIEAVESIVGE